MKSNVITISSKKISELEYESFLFKNLKLIIVIYANEPLLQKMI